MHYIGGYSYNSLKFFRFSFISDKYNVQDDSKSLYCLEKFIMQRKFECHPILQITTYYRFYTLMVVGIRLCVCCYVHVVMCMVLCAWCYVHGVMCMLLCAWCYVHGVMCMLICALGFNLII